MQVSITEDPALSNQWKQMWSLLSIVYMLIRFSSLPWQLSWSYHGQVEVYCHCKTHKCILAHNVNIMQIDQRLGNAWIQDFSICIIIDSSRLFLSSVPLAMIFQVIVKAAIEWVEDSREDTRYPLLHLVLTVNCWQPLQVQNWNPSLSLRFARFYF